MDETRRNAAKTALRQGIQGLGFSRAMASAIANEHRLPSLRHAIAIEDALGIPCRAWIDGNAVAEMWRVMAEQPA